MMSLLYTEGAEEDAEDVAVGVVNHGLWHERRFGRRGWKSCGWHLRGGKVAGLQGENPLPL